MGQLGFADAFLAGKAGQNRRLSRIEGLIDWSALATVLPRAASSGPGRPAYAPLAMFKALLLAQWYQLSDPALEEAMADRISFRRFCGFALDEVTPDETTFCRFRQALAHEGRADRLMAELDRQLGQRGFLVKEGTMIDATLIEAHAARPPFQPAVVPPSEPPSEPSFEPSFEPVAPPSEPPRDRVATTAAGVPPTGLDHATPPAPPAPQPHPIAAPSAVLPAASTAAAPATPPTTPPATRTPGRSRVDPDARFARKGGKTVFGYKAHVAVDVGSGLIRRACLTPANINDTTPADGLVMGDERAVYADMAYATHARRRALKARGIKDRILHRPNKHHPKLPRLQARRNALIRPIRLAVERTFGTWKRSYGYRCVRYVSLAANAVELQLKAIAYNLRRVEVLAGQALAAQALARATLA